MKLIDLLAALSSNSNVRISLKDEAGATLITFDAPGYRMVEGDLGTYDVKQITVRTATALEVTVAPGE